MKQKLIDDIARKSGLSGSEKLNFIDKTANLLRSIDYKDLLELPISYLLDLCLYNFKFINNVTVYPKVEIREFKQRSDTNSTVILILTKNLQFVVDSIRMVMLKNKIKIKLLAYNDGLEESKYINCVLIVDYIYEERLAKEIEQQILNTIDDVNYVVSDWKSMQSQLKTTINQIKSDSKFNHFPPESIDFLTWLSRKNFTFFGFCIYSCKKDSCQIKPELSLGLAKNITNINKLSLTQNLIKQNKTPRQDLYLGKLPNFATVHRPTFTDYVSVITKSGDLYSEYLFFGLYTLSAYGNSSFVIPMLRNKIEQVIAKTGYKNNSYSYRVIKYIIESLPNDELFRLTTDELYELVTMVLHIHERDQVKVFIRNDAQYFYTVFVYLPRDVFTSQIKYKIIDTLMRNLHGIDYSYKSNITESQLARLDFSILVDSFKGYEHSKIEQEINQITSSWNNNLTKLLFKNFHLERAVSYESIYLNKIPTAYKEIFSPDEAIDDINDIAKLAIEPIVVRGSNNDLLKFISIDALSLSKVVQILNNLSITAIDSGRFEFELEQRVNIVYFNIDELELEQGLFAELSKLITLILKDCYHDDQFNSLLVNCHCNIRQIDLIRALCRYLTQSGITYSTDFIISTLGAYKEQLKLIIDLFESKFKEPIAEKVSKRVLKSIEKIKLIDEYKVFISLYNTILKLVRTNYYQANYNSSDLNYLAFKFKTSEFIESFIFSTDVEGVHIRTSLVARGGIRNSDRQEDYRREVIDLVNTQQVKNSIIIPTGAKGGFLVKGDQDTQQCYTKFIRGLLALVDNYKKDHKQLKSKQVTYDEFDPYLVVAADKGTATFSDIANNIAINEYNFWLGDAFASGGGNGYDHKKIGITAKGAWRSLEHHVYYLGLNPNCLTFVGIGDLAGDVFGNGMILSEQIKLIAAFNHKYIFIDPTPDLALSYKERLRLFKGSKNWDEYDSMRISYGGGIFSRQSKEILLNSQIRSCLNIPGRYKKISPNDLIKYILKSSSDVIWNGGIGTFFKSKDETNIDVADKLNDDIRVNADQIKAKIIIEGGNLGISIKARTEYSQMNGMCNADYIDNAAGVNCSDLEVNIKILLNYLLSRSIVTTEEKNKVFSKARNEVSKLVIDNVYQQNLAITLVASNSDRNKKLYKRIISSLQEDGYIEEEHNFSNILTRSQACFLISTQKIYLNNILMEIDLEKLFPEYFNYYFPQSIVNKYKDSFPKHIMSRQILATTVANELTNSFGIGVFKRLVDETGLEVNKIIIALLNVMKIMDYKLIRDQIFAANLNLEDKITAIVLFNKIIRKIVRSALKLELLDTNKKIIYISESLNKLDLSSYFDSKVNYKELKSFNSVRVEQFIEQLPKLLDLFYVSINVIDEIGSKTLDINKFVKILQFVERELNLTDIRNGLKNQSVENYWEAMERANLFDRLDSMIVKFVASKYNISNTKEAVLINADKLDKWHEFLQQMLKEEVRSYTMYAVALNKLQSILL